MRTQHSFGLWDRAAFGPLLAAVPALFGLGGAGAGAAVGAASLGGTLAAGAAGVGAGAAAAGGITAGTILGGLSAAAGLASAGASLLTASKKPPTPPPVSTPVAPTAPSFAAGLSGGTNLSLAAQSPFAALGGTSTGNFGSTGSGSGKTLLGQ